MRPKELQEDVEWLEELLAIKVRVGRNHPSFSELEEEIAKTRKKIATHDYNEREEWKATHFQEKGPHDCAIF